ncbi:MAG: metalloregulator ArsR/SmtB family transcription factor [Myxococcota bacterium]
MVTSDAVLDALGNATRRSIVRVLAGGPLTVGAIALELPVSRPAVSQHLRVLEQAELVRFTESGTKNLYELDRAGFLAARAWLETFWSESLAQFAALAEATQEGG